MHATFTVIAKMTMDHQPGAKQSQLLYTDLRLELSKNMDKAAYLQRDLPTKEAIKPISSTLLLGLITNIKMAHEKGWWDEVEHIRYIIDELGRAFAHNAKITEATMER